jgi:hypothetical protein
MRLKRAREVHDELANILPPKPRKKRTKKVERDQD